MPNPEEMKPKENSAACGKGLIHHYNDSNEISTKQESILSSLKDNDNGLEDKNITKANGGSLAVL